jgi:phosphoglycolate phosphatase
MAPKFVMFDIDGTLADTMPQLVDALVEYLRGYLRQDGRPPREHIMDLLHMSPPEMLAAFVEVTGRPASQIQSEFKAITEGLPAHLFAEVLAVLEALKASGYVILVSSTTPEVAVRGRLEALGIAERCELALGTNVQARITKEDHPRVAADRLGLSADQFAAAAVFVGDMPGDMQLARKAGMLAIGRLTGDNANQLRGAGAHHVISDLTELEALLRAPA